MSNLRSSLSGVCQISYSHLGTHLFCLSPLPSLLLHFICSCFIQRCFIMLEEVPLAPYLCLIIDLSFLHPSSSGLFFSLPFFFFFFTSLFGFVRHLSEPSLSLFLHSPFNPPATCAASLPPSHITWQQPGVLVILVAWFSCSTRGRPHPGSVLHPSTALQSSHTGWHQPFCFLSHPS